jgi:hypothetical protein
MCDTVTQSVDVVTHVVEKGMFLTRRVVGLRAMLALLPAAEPPVAAAASRDTMLTPTRTDTHAKAARGKYF